MFYNGHRVILTDGGSMAPVRRHSRSANGGKASYHRRIKKKWIKRFGEKWVETQRRGEVFIDKLNNTIIVRRDDWAEIQRQIPAEREQEKT